MDWNEEAYRKQLAISRKLTDKGIIIALNQKDTLTPEAREAYEDTLRERHPQATKELHY
jgi:hypothetical protein